MDFIKYLGSCIKSYLRDNLDISKRIASAYSAMGQLKELFSSIDVPLDVKPNVSSHPGECRCMGLIYLGTP
jgi:hypothetical protein